MKILIFISTILLCQSVLGADYMNRKNTINACSLFAKDAYQASVQYVGGVALPELLSLIDQAPVSDSAKQRAFQAIQFVWKNQVSEPVMAYSLAMGMCLAPKDFVAPVDEPWITSPRQNQHYF